VFDDQHLSDVARHLNTAITNKNDQELISIIARYDNEPLQAIAAAYLKQFGKALPEAIKDASSGEFSHLLIDLIIPRAYFAARTIHNAITGAGTDEKAIIDAIVHNSPQQIAAIKEAYSNIFARDLAGRIASDLSGHFRKAVANVLEGKKHDAIGDPHTEAETLYKKGEGKWGTDDDYFVEFFTRNSFDQLQAINHAYNAKYGHNLEVAAKRETSGAYQDILVALVQPREVYWAHRIRHAIAGLGTDDILLRRAFALNSKDQLRRIDAVYSAVNPGKSLLADVSDDTSGKYKQLYQAVLASL